MSYFEDDYEDLYEAEKATKVADEELKVAISKRVAAGNEELKQILVRMLEFSPEVGFPETITPMYLNYEEEVTDPKSISKYRQEQGLNDRNIPFFCEAYLYELLGKEDARSILGFLNQIAIALGYEGYRDLRQEAKDDSSRKS